MSNIRYQRGFALENKLVRHLKKELKWPYAIRTAGSHSPCDVLGITPNGVAVMFQCKSTEKDSFDLAKLFDDVSVFRLKRMPTGIRKVVLIKIGFKHTTEYYIYEWSYSENDWIEFDSINFKTKTTRK